MALSSVMFWSRLFYLWCLRGLYVLPATGLAHVHLNVGICMLTIRVRLEAVHRARDDS